MTEFETAVVERLEKILLIMEAARMERAAEKDGLRSIKSHAGHAPDGTPKKRCGHNVVLRD